MKLIDDPKYGVIVSDAKRIQIKNFIDGIKIKDFGEEKRKYKETLINEYSSRSHTVYQIFLENISMNEGNDKVVSKYSILNLIDLAGSEKLHERETTSGETGYINKSLFCLTNVINKLAEGKKKCHIPYRDSKLTRLLSVALGGNSLITIICTVSPSATNFFQTLSTLRFASRAKIVLLKPGINEFYDEKEMIEIYKNELLKMKEGNDIILEENEEEPDEEDTNEEGNKDYKLMYFHEALDNKRLKLDNEKLQKDLEKSFLRLSMLSGEDYQKNKISKDNYETMFLDPYVKDINNMINQNYSKSDNYYPYFISQLNQITSEYQNQLNSLQQFYLSKIKELQSNIMKTKGVSDSFLSNNLNISIENKISSSENYLISPLSIENFSKNLGNKKLFNKISLYFSSDKDIQIIKKDYENKVDLLEGTYLQYKSFLENYFQDISNDYYSSRSNDTNRIKQINMEFERFNKSLNELYEEKQGELEINFFDILRKITNFQREKSFSQYK
ncbi:MAG: kinesin family protein [archaeon]|nr:kinesin family protein [archaeon]